MREVAPGEAGLEALRAVADGSPLRLADGWRGPVEASQAALATALRSGAPLYGVNTGFGKLAQTRIADDALAELQLNLLRSHAAGVGKKLAPRIVRLVLALKALSLADRKSVV